MLLHSHLLFALPYPALSSPLFFLGADHFTPDHLHKSDRFPSHASRRAGQCHRIVPRIRIERKTPEDEQACSGGVYTNDQGFSHPDAFHEYICTCLTAVGTLDVHAARARQTQPFSDDSCPAELELDWTSSARILRRCTTLLASPASLISRKASIWVEWC